MATRHSPLTLKKHIDAMPMIRSSVKQPSDKDIVYRHTSPVRACGELGKVYDTSTHSSLLDVSSKYHNAKFKRDDDPERFLSMLEDFGVTLGSWLDCRS